MQSVKVNRSVLEPVTSGVPQGSIVVPLLFIYANDLSYSVLFSICFSYADEFKHLHNDPDLSPGRLQQDLKRLENWCSFNKLFFSAKKCFFLNVRNCPNNLTIGEEATKSPDSVEDLGLITKRKVVMDEPCRIQNRRKIMVFISFAGETPRTLSMVNKLDLYNFSYSLSQ